MRCSGMALLHATIAHQARLRRRAITHGARSGTKALGFAYAAGPATAATPHGIPARRLTGVATMACPVQRPRPEARFSLVGTAPKRARPFWGATCEATSSGRTAARA